MTYLVDSNVLSEATRVSPDNKVVSWLTDHERELVVDPIVLGELRMGILALPRGRKRAQLERWFEALSATITCLPWDRTVSARWAQLVTDLKRKGQTLPLLDSMIAATALVHKLTIATRNVSNFQPAGVRIINPFT
ncbi:MAG: type II toxin-antitoxin system VapC family toxin [Candidatus Hydrogenedentes bacterium]|nr:type II toxin-antitoxin system VapC family toxin [Candidatus Hydrogenedentota bacterium]